VPAVKFFWANLPLDAFRRVPQPANGMFASENLFSLSHVVENYFDAAKHLSGIIFHKLNSNPIRTNTAFNPTGKTPLCERRTGFFTFS
jgi:hypothetical protein